MYFILILTIIILIILLIFSFTKNKENLSNIIKGPNIIQTWKTKNIPKKYELFVKKIKELNPKSKYIFFSDADINKFVKDKFPEYYDIYVKLPYKIQKIDFFRYLAIYFYGGVYLDLDISLTKTLLNIDKDKICKFPLEYNQNSDEILQKQGFNGLIGNYAFYAPKKSHFIKKIIDNIVTNRINLDNLNLDYKKMIFYTTGPVLVTQTYIDYEHKEKIKLLKTKPFMNHQFGNYGRHHLMGSWKK